METESGIGSDLLTLKFGESEIRVYTHGGINTIHSRNTDVTSQNDMNKVLVALDRIDKQRGGNPLMGPSAGRYDKSVISQPGPVDIHGVFAALPWEINNIDTDKNFVELRLPAAYWKGAITDYYFFAAREDDPNAENRLSLARFVSSLQKRFKDENTTSMIKEVNSLIGSAEIDKNYSTLASLISQLVEIAFPGNVDVIRRITIEDMGEGNITSFYDEVWFKNLGNEDYLDSSGFHTYFNAFLSEIVLPEDFWSGKVPKHFDDNLSDVQVRVLDQVKRLGRWVIIIPESELRSPNSNQIIYKDPTTIGVPDAAIENWRQPGNSNNYPHTGRIVKPGETSHIGFRTIVVQGPEIPTDILDYIDAVNADLSQAP